MTVRTDLRLPDGARILHIGPPKTGTTALQGAFHVARKATERQGVHYASTGRHAMTAVLAATGMPSPWAADRKPPPAWNWTRLRGSILGSKAARVVLSSEFFADASPEAIRRVVGELDPERVQIVVTLRPLARILPSQWQQFVQNQLTQPFDEWLDGLLNRPRGEVTPAFWRRHRHDELVARWTEVVGPERMTVVALDDRDRDMVLRVFEQLTGLTTGMLVAEPDLANRSMTVPEIEVVRAFNAAFRASKLPAPLYGRIMRFGAAAEMRVRTPEPDEARIELPAWSREPIATLAREMMAAIRASGVRIIGDLDLLTTVPRRCCGGAAPVAVSPAVAASAAMGVLVASGLARGTRLDRRRRVGRDRGRRAGRRSRAAGRVRSSAAPRPGANRADADLDAAAGLVILRRWRAAATDRMARLLGRRKD